MSQLHTRGKCQIRGCECSGFMTVELNVLSSTPKEACICTHPYWQHLMTAQNMFSRNRWANTERACGGFYPANVTEPLGLNPDCLCLASWLSHSIYKNNADGSIAVANDRPENPVASTSVATTHREPSSRNMPSIASRPENPVALTSAAMVTRRELSSTSSHPPIGAFVPRTVSPAGDSNSRRNASMQRSRDRRSGHERHTLPSEGSATEFLALLLPFKPESCESPSYRFNSEETTLLFTTLKQHHLTCLLHLSGDNIWTDIHQQISASLSRSGISLTVYNGRFSEDARVLSSPLTLIAPRCTRYGVRQLFKEIELGGYAPTLHELAKIAERVKISREDDDRPLLFFAPYFDHLKGPISQSVVPHACFPWRVWKDLQNVSPTPTNMEAYCVSSCPGDSQRIAQTQISTQGIIPQLSLTRAPTPGPSAVPTASSSTPMQRNILDGNSVNRPQLDPPGTPLQNPSAQRQSHPPIQMRYDDITQWQGAVFAAKTSDNHGGLLARGPSAESVAQALINMLQFHRTCFTDPTGAVFNVPDGVTCLLQPLDAFVSRQPRFAVQTNTARPGAVGNGPCRAVMRAGVKLLTSSTLFGHHGDFYHPLFHGMESSSSPRVIQSWAAGYWCALHILLLGHIPDPITPWLFFAILYGKDGLPCDIDQLRALDPKLSNDLEPWFHFGAQDTLSPADVQHPVWQLFLNYAAFHDLSILATPRSQEFHQELTEALVAGAIFGSSNPWQGSEYKAFRDGFNLDLGHTHLLDTLRLGDQPHYGRQLLTFMSNRRITDVADVIMRLEFVMTETMRPSLHDAITDVFQYHVLRWLRRKGHPTELRGSHVPVEDFDRDRDDSLLRARLLLRALADTDLLPLDPSFTIKLALSIPAPTASTEPSTPPVLDIHTCEARANISINEWLQGALQEDCTLHDQICTRFDVWMHTQVILSGYNSI